VPDKASFAEQLDIFGNKHTYFCTITYVMTFGSFSGLSAAFPLLIKTVYGNFEGAPDPLKYAYLGPLIGSAMRVLAGPLTDRFGGAIFTQLCGLGLIAGAATLGFGGLLTPASLDQFPMFVWVMLAMFFFTGVGNAATFRQYPVIFSHSPRHWIHRRHRGLWSVPVLHAHRQVQDRAGIRQAVLHRTAGVLCRGHGHQLVVLLPQGRRETLLTAFAACGNSPINHERSHGIQIGVRRGGRTTPRPSLGQKRGGQTEHHPDPLHRRFHAHVCGVADVWCAGHPHPQGVRFERGPVRLAHSHRHP
jgi:hypothetical protein